MAQLFVIDLEYIASLDQVEAHMAGHRDHLADHYATGTFVASGRKVPRTGGVILATGERAQIEQIVATDPFVVNAVTRATITAFTPTMTAAASTSLQEPPA